MHIFEILEKLNRGLDSSLKTHTANKNCPMPNASRDIPENLFPCFFHDEARVNR